MTWFKVSDDVWSHPKTNSVSHSAMGGWVMAASWAAKHLTNGRIPGRMVAKLGLKKRAVNELVEAGLWRADGADFVFHDWLEYNKDAEEIKAKRARDRERKKEIPRGKIAEVAQPSAVDARELNPSPVSRTRNPLPGTANAVPELRGGASAPPPPAESTAVVRVSSAAIKKPPKPSKSGPVWAAYAEAYLARYGVEPTRNARVNGQLSQFVSRVPEADAPDVARFFVAHNDPWYVRRGHSAGDLLQAAEKLHMEFQRGRPVTDTEARHAGTVDEVRATADAARAIREGWRRAGND